MPSMICCWVLLLSTIAVALAQQNPSILEDARVHPTSDGTFGFLYRTQDGISHAAKGDPGGAVHGRFTYTDPTGLKVNFNYNAGAQAVKQPQAAQPQQQHYQPAPAPQPRYQPQAQPQRQPQAQPQRQPQAQAQPQERYTQAQYEDDYQQDMYSQQQQQYQPQPQQQPRYQQPQYRPRPPVRNDIYDYDDNQRYDSQRYRQ